MLFVVVEDNELVRVDSQNPSNPNFWGKIMKIYG